MKALKVLFDRFFDLGLQLGWGHGCSDSGESSGPLILKWPAFC